MAKQYGYSLRKRKASHCWGNIDDDNRIVGFDDLHNLSTTTKDFTGYPLPRVEDLENYFNGNFDRKTRLFLKKITNDDYSDGKCIEQYNTKNDGISEDDSHEISTELDSETVKNFLRMLKHEYGNSADHIATIFSDNYQVYINIYYHVNILLKLI